jgi:hypothetical protein
LGLIQPPRQRPCQIRPSLFHGKESETAALYDFVWYYGVSAQGYPHSENRGYRGDGVTIKRFDPHGSIAREGSTPGAENGKDAVQPKYRAYFRFGTELKAIYSESIFPCKFEE